MSYRFNTPPGWPSPPQGWRPPEGWTPDPSWPPAPQGWEFWVAQAPAEPAVDAPGGAPADARADAPVDAPAAPAAGASGDSADASADVASVDEAADTRLADGEPVHLDAVEPSSADEADSGPADPGAAAAPAPTEQFDLQQPQWGGIPAAGPTASLPAQAPGPAGAPFGAAPHAGGYSPQPGEFAQPAAGYQQQPAQGYEQQPAGFAQAPGGYAQQAGGYTAAPPPGSGSQFGGPPPGQPSQGGPFGPGGGPPKKNRTPLIAGGIVAVVIIALIVVLAVRMISDDGPPDADPPSTSAPTASDPATAPEPTDDQTDAGTDDQTDAGTDDQTDAGTDAAAGDFQTLSPGDQIDIYGVTGDVEVNVQLASMERDWQPDSSQAIMCGDPEGEYIALEFEFTTLPALADGSGSYTFAGFEVGMANANGTALDVNGVAGLFCLTDDMQAPTEVGPGETFTGWTIIDAPDEATQVLWEPFLDFTGQQPTYAWALSDY